MPNEYFIHVICLLILPTETICSLYGINNIRKLCLTLLNTYLGVLKYVCVRGVMDVVFSVCIVTRGAVDASVWEV